MAVDRSRGHALDYSTLKDLQRWRDSNSPAFSLLDYLYGNAHLEVAIAFTALFWPETLEQQGGVFLRDKYSRALFESWLDAYNGDIHNVQLSMNQVILGDLLPGKEEMSDDNLRFLAETIADMWSSRLAKLYPHREFSVECYQTNLDWAVTFAARASAGTKSKSTDLRT